MSIFILRQFIIALEYQRIYLLLYLLLVGQVDGRLKY